MTKTQESPRPDRILIVDDVEQNIAVLTSTLEPSGCEILAVTDSAKALALAIKAVPDLIILDIMMPGISGLELCQRLQQNHVTSHIPVIFITARNETSAIVEGFQAGGVDYIVKPFAPEEVLSRVNTHLRTQRLTRELTTKNQELLRTTEELRAEIQRRKTVEGALKDADEKLSAFSTLEADRWNASGLLGQSHAMQKLEEDLKRLKLFTHTSVLITGESGTGKELVAKAIHFGSSRSRGPFIPVNCVAVPPDLAESMLFGHVKGAFTGAATDRKGYFELAHGGTLFLDEIGDMPAPLQAKLLRVLEDGLVTPIGSAETKKVDVRVVAATNAHLESKIASGSFREDLYFRLARFHITTTPLRERTDDVPRLASHFLRTFAQEMGIKPPPITPETLNLLREYHFPGNVRELRNIIERALIESGGDLITTQHIHLLRHPLHPATAQSSPPGPSTKSRAKSQPQPHPQPTEARGDEELSKLPLNLAEVEDLLIQRALHETQGNIADAARLLGVHRTRIYRKLAKEEEPQPPQQPPP